MTGRGRGENLDAPLPRFVRHPASLLVRGPARDEADYIELSLGSIMPSDLEGLESWGVFGTGLEEGEEEGEEEEDEKKVVVLVRKGGKTVPVAAGLEKVSVAGRVVVVGKLGGGGSVGRWRRARRTGVGRERGVKVK